MYLGKYIYEDRLESERLITRFVQPSDSTIWLSFFEEPECVKYFPTFGLNTAKERTKHWMNRCFSRYDEKSFGLQALIDKNTGDYIGQCGLLAQTVEGISELEVGYHLLKPYWGKGYATEAATLFKNYGFKNELADSIISIIHKDNILSQKVALRHGLMEDKHTKWNDLDVIIFRQLKP